MSLNKVSERRLNAEWANRLSVASADQKKQCSLQPDFELVRQIFEAGVGVQNTSNFLHGPDVDTTVLGVLLGSPGFAGLADRPRRACSLGRQRRSKKNHAFGRVFKHYGACGPAKVPRRGLSASRAKPGLPSVTPSTVFHISISSIRCNNPTIGSHRLVIPSVGAAL